MYLNTNRGMLVQCRVLAAAVLKEKMKIERDSLEKKGTNAK